MQKVNYDVWNEMKKQRSRLDELQSLITKLMTEHGSPEEIRNLQYSYWADLAALNLLKRRFISSLFSAVGYICIGLSAGVVAMIYFEHDSCMSAFLIGICSVSYIYCGKKELIG